MPSQMGLKVVAALICNEDHEEEHLYVPFRPAALRSVSPAYFSNLLLSISAEAQLRPKLRI